MSDNTALVEEIAQALTEKNVDLIKTAVEVIGAERAQAFLRQALAVEAEGGMMTSDQSRRRTPGGVFFQLIRKGTTKEERKIIFPVMRTQKKKRAKAPTPKAPTPTMTWEEAKAMIAQAIKATGEARTVKLNLVGRPLKIIQQKECVVVSLKGKQPPALPKGLPPVPEGSAITWAVFIANSQWSRVKASIEQNEKDALIIEGYPIVGKNGVAAVMTTNCKSIWMERAAREGKKA